MASFTGELLNVNGRSVLTTDVTLDDLYWLYRNFEKENGHIPVFAECLSKNNLPQGRIVNRVLRDNNITYNEFMKNLGKFSKVRTECVEDYDYYVSLFVEVAKSNGKPLSINQFLNNKYGLPGYLWFIKYCPDKTVRSYPDFVRWCGLEYKSRTNDKDSVATALIELEKNLGRPITTDDIKNNSKALGFSLIVIKRLWGGFKNAKKELGLMETPPQQPRPFDYYKNNLDKILDYIKETSDVTYITWSDIEKNSLNIPAEHKTLTAAFKREGLDIFKYVYDRGFQMKPHSQSFREILPSGEKVVSRHEHKFSTFLNDELDLVYDIDYKRDVMYKKFLNCCNDSKTNCDYIIQYDDKKYLIEIAGMISSERGKWAAFDYGDKRKNEYRDKMIAKKKILDENGIRYLFLFADDFIGEDYKWRTVNFLHADWWWYEPFEGLDLWTRYEWGDCRVDLDENGEPYERLHFDFD